MSDKFRIAYLGWHNPLDKKSLSGTPYQLCRSLEKIGYDIKWVKIKYTYVYRIFAKIFSLMRMNVIFTHSILGALLQSRTIRSRYLEDCDLVFAPFASEALFCLKTDKPIIYLSDATFNLMVGYYYKNLSAKSIRQGNIIEKRALEKSMVVIVSSDWAYQSVIHDYNQDPSKVHVIEFGANIDEKDIIPRTFMYNGHLDLLFLGVDWVRKGGPIAVEACRFLNENGIPSTLHVIGVSSLESNIKELPYVDFIGFLDKNDKDQYQKLIETIKKCHCLLLPTLAECAGIAFCESSANGLPVFSHETGGVGNYVVDGKNGYLLPIGSTGADFGKKIKECLYSGKLEQMSITAKAMYKEKLNWNVWADRVSVVISKIFENGRNE